MDHFDRQILNLLQVNSRISTEDIGAQIGLSASACQRRIRALKDAGIIQREVVILNAEKFSDILTVIVDITLHKGGNKEVARFIDSISHADAVQQIYYVAGESDFVVIMICNSIAEYDMLAERLFMENSNVKKFISKIAIARKKFEAALPL